MDKTFRLLLIAAIIIAISMGLSAFKKSKSADSVTNDAQVMVDGQQTYKMSEKVEPVTPADTKNLEKRDGKLDADAADTAENMDKKVSEPKSEHQDDSEANKESDKQVVAQQQSNRIIAYHHENGMVDTNHADEQDHVADNHADEQDHVADNHADEQDHVADNHADEQDHVADNHAKDQIIADGDDKDLDED